MTGTLRIVLLIAAILTAVFMLTKIRNSKIKIEDSVFWLVFSITLALLAIFPIIAETAADMIGIISPVNCIFLIIIFILIIKIFFMTIKISQIESKLEHLVQEIAIKNTDK